MSEYLRLPGELQSEYPTKDYCINGHNYCLKPFKIYGNLYFVGDKDVSVHLIDTGEGLILLDSGYPHMAAFLLQSIWELNFTPADIKYIVHTHGHYDHYGATNTIVTLSGAETFLGMKDVEMLHNCDYDVASLNNVAYHSYSSMFKVDHEMQDGDIIELGNTKLQVVSTPGHTPGCMSVFFDITENGKTLTAGMHGGVGFNTMHLLYMHLLGNKTAHDDFIWGLNRIYDKNVDITLGNHTIQNKTEDKMHILLNKRDIQNPFIDKTEWKKWLDKLKLNFYEMVKYETTNFQPLLERTVKQ